MKKWKILLMMGMICLLLGGCGKETILNGIVYGSADADGGELLRHLERCFFVEEGKGKISIKELDSKADGQRYVNVASVGKNIDFIIGSGEVLSLYGSTDQTKRLENLKEFLPEDLYQCLEEENRFLEAGDAINGRVPVAIGIFDTDLKEDLGLSGNCAILAVGRQTPHKDAVIEMLRYEFMDEDDPQEE